LPLNEPKVIEERLGGQVDVIVDGSNGGLEPTTIIDLVEGTPLIVRHGAGDISKLH